MVVERSLSFVASLYQGAAGLILLMTGALLIQNSPFSWHWFRTVTQTSEVFCPDRSASYSITTDMYQAFAVRTDLHGQTVKVVHQILGTPACSLSPIKIRANSVTDRQVYYLEDQTAIVVAYEDGQYVGHSVEGEALIDTVVTAQSWSVSSGDHVGRYRVLAGLGELSLRTQDFLQAPEPGVISRQVKWSSQSEESTDESTATPLASDCVTYTSTAYPTYLSRFCGLGQSRTGALNRSDRFGQVGGVLHFALLTLRPTENQVKQWHYVAPSPEFITQFF